MNCSYCGHALTPFTKFCTKCGNPAPAPQPAQATYTPPVVAPPPPLQQPRTSWGAGAESAPRTAPRRKSRAGKILLVVFTILVLLGVGAGALVYFGFRALKSGVKSSEAYTAAERELRESRSVAERLGEIKETGFPVGTYKEEPNGAGSAIFTVSVEGTKASGRYFVTMERTRGVWHVERGYVQIEGTNESINVVDDGGTGEGTETDGPTVNAPPPPAPPQPPPGTKGAVISGGVLNGKAKSKPEPPYPAIAKAAKAQGTVTVQVVVDESGKVISASAVSGHPLLQQAAVQAARQATFEPTKVSGKPAKVSGVLTYNFVLPQ